MIFRNFVL